MKIKDFIDEIITTSLSSTYISEPEKREAVMKELLLHVRRTLEQIYTRFPIKQRAIYLELQESRTSYPIEEQYFLTLENPHPDYEHYLWDEDTIHKLDPAYQALNPAPYDEEPPHTDLIKILAVEDSEGNRYKLNDAYNPNSLSTPTFNVLQVPNPQVGKQLVIIYQAKHPEVTDEESELEVPALVLEAMKAYIAGNVLLKLGTQTSIQQSNIFFQQYDALTRLLIESDSINVSETSSNPKFKENGWI